MQRNFQLPSTNSVIKSSYCLGEEDSNLAKDTQIGLETTMGGAGSVQKQTVDLPQLEIDPMEEEQSTSFHEMNTFAVSGKLMRASFSSSRISRQNTMLDSSSVDTAITEHACLLDYYCADSEKNIEDETMFPTLFKVIYLKQRAIAMNPKARALFLRYFASGCWIKSMTGDKISVPRSPTNLKVVQDELFDSLIIVVALKSFANSDVYRYMTEENWKTDLDLITFIMPSPTAGQGRRSFLMRSLIGDDAAPSSVAFRLQTRMPLLTSDFIEQTITNTAWLFDLQKSIDELPFGLSLHCPRPGVSVLTGGGPVPFSRSYRNTFATFALPPTDYSDTLPTKWTQAVKRGEIVRASVVSVDQNEQVDVSLHPVLLLDGRCRGALALWAVAEKQQLGSAVFDLGCLLSKLCV